MSTIADDRDRLSSCKLVPRMGTKESGTLNEGNLVHSRPPDVGNVVVAYPPNSPWIGVLRHSLERCGLSIVSAEDLVDCRNAVRERMRSLLLFEIAADEATERLEAIQEICETQPRTKAVVLLREIDDEIERMLRELGACDVIRHPTQYKRIVQIARSHARNARDDRPTPTLSSSESS